MLRNVLLSVIILFVLCFELEFLVALEKFITQKNLVQVIVNNEVIYEGPLYKINETENGIIIYNRAFFSKVQSRYISKNIEVKPLNEI